MFMPVMQQHAPNPAQQVPGNNDQMWFSISTSGFFRCVEAKSSNSIAHSLVSSAPYVKLYKILDPIDSKPNVQGLVTVFQYVVQDI
jgi:hypothetical protein